MRGLILAAGRGSRMKESTVSKPKCLVTLAGRTLLDWQLDAFMRAGMPHVALVTGYQSEQLSALGRICFQNDNWQHSNMVRSLLCAAPWIRPEGALVSYSDIVYHPSILEALEASEADLAITWDRQWHPLWSLRFEDPLSDAETFATDAEGWIQDIGRKPTDPSEVQGQYMGLLRFSAAGWRVTEDWLRQQSEATINKLDMTTLLRSLIQAGIRIKGVPIDGHWCEVDSETDRNRIEQRLLEDGLWSHDWRSLDHIQPPLLLQGTVVWITGLSGSGKTTIATSLARILREKGHACVVLDGDSIRAAIRDPHVGFDRQSRLTNAYRIARLSQLVAHQNVIVIVATMSLFHEIHAWNRTHLPHYVEVLVEADLQALKQSDYQGLYRSASAGNVQNVIGHDQSFELPQLPTLRLNNGFESESLRIQTPDSLASQILPHLSI